LIRLLESFIGLWANKNYKIITVLRSFRSQKTAKRPGQKTHQHRQWALPGSGGVLVGLYLASKNEKKKEKKEKEKKEKNKKKGGKKGIESKIR